jgi:hypothetical protein
MEENWGNKKKSFWDHEGKKLKWIKIAKKIRDDIRRIIKIIVIKRLTSHDEINKIKRKRKSCWCNHASQERRSKANKICWWIIKK